MGWVRKLYDVTWTLIRVCLNMHVCVCVFLSLSLSLYIYIIFILYQNEKREVRSQ